MAGVYVSFDRNFDLNINEVNHLVIHSRNIEPIGFSLNLGKATKTKIQAIIDSLERLKVHAVD